MGVDADGNKGTLLTPTFQGHLDHTVGDKSPPPMFPLVRHDGSLEGSERAARHHRSVCQGSVAEETAAGRRGYSGEYREVFSGLLQDSCNFHLVKILGVVSDSGGLLLDSGGREPSEGAEELGTDGKDTGTRGRQPTGLGDVFQGGGTGGPPV